MPTPLSARSQHRVRRQDVERALQDKKIDLAKVDQTAGVSQEVKDALRAADVDGDGFVSRRNELRRAFSAMDHFDRDGSRDSLYVKQHGLLTPAGRGIAAMLMHATPDAAASSTAASDTRAATADATHPPSSDLPAGRQMGVAKGTGYYPANSRMEGGFVDKRGKKLRTLQDFLDGKSDYVSIALDKKLYRSGAVRYGDRFRIPELEKKYGRPIEFRAVDTGGAFTNKGFSRVDICTKNRRHSLDSTVNGRLTLVKVD